MMYTCRRSFHFSAAHQTGTELNHMHGHNFVLTVELKNSEVNGRGVVKDNIELDPIQSFIDEELDGRCLNDVFGEMQPTAENLCHWLYFKLHTMGIPVNAVELSETPNLSCRYE
jgi:6-pyruvoyltetrahydropterin/6-carboxytetrahydropterin synthase